MVLDGGSSHLKSIHKFSMYMYNYIVKLIFSKENITIYKMYQNTTTMPNENFKIENKNKNNCIYSSSRRSLSMQ